MESHWPLSSSTGIRWPLSSSTENSWTLSFSTETRRPVSSPTETRWPLSSFKETRWPLSSSKVIRWPLSSSTETPWSPSLSTGIRWPHSSSTETRWPLSSSTETQWPLETRWPFSIEGWGLQELFYGDLGYRATYPWKIEILEKLCFSHQAFRQKIRVLHKPEVNHLLPKELNLHPFFTKPTSLRRSKGNSHFLGESGSKIEFKILSHRILGSLRIVPFPIDPLPYEILRLISTFQWKS